MATLFNLSLVRFLSCRSSRNGVALLYVYRKGSNALGGTKGDGQEGGEEESEGGKT